MSENNKTYERWYNFVVPALGFDRFRLTVERYAQGGDRFRLEYRRF